MTAKVWNVGDVLTAADLDAFAVPQSAYKTAPTSRTSTTTLAADPDLTVPLVASANYRFWCYLNFEGAATGSGDLKFSFSVPAGATLRYHLLSNTPVGTPGFNDLAVGITSTAATAEAASTAGAGIQCSVSMQGTLAMGSTAGSITLQWAQQTSSATSTILDAQSALVLDRI